MRAPVTGADAPYLHRIRALQHALHAARLDVLLVTHPANVRYLTGFHGSSGALLVAASAVTLVVDGRYVTAARDLVARTPALRDIQVELFEGIFEAAVAQLVSRVPNVREVGFEASSVTVSAWQRLVDALRNSASSMAPRLRATEGLVEQERLVKDAVEIALLREAARRLSNVFRRVLPAVEVGRTEREIAALVEAELRRLGFERPAFDTIVASGPNAALPHARAGARCLEPGDGVLLDFGGVYDGYCVDLCRTVQLAPTTDEFGRLFDTVRDAHAAAIRAVGPGVKASDIDRAARDVLQHRGYGSAFVHGTGHGLGLEVHEQPRLTRSGAGHVDHLLRPGMVFTIEPGLYLPGVGGVRLEDDVVVVDAGCEVLTNVPIDRWAAGSPRQRMDSPTGAE